MICHRRNPMVRSIPRSRFHQRDDHHELASAALPRSRKFHGVESQGTQRGQREQRGARLQPHRIGSESGIMRRRSGSHAVIRTSAPSPISR